MTGRRGDGAVTAGVPVSLHGSERQASPGTGGIEVVGAAREQRLDLEHSGGAVTTNLYASPTTGWELAQRSRIRAFRAGGHVLVVAEGNVPTPGYEVDIVQSPLKIFPPQFNLLHRQRPGIWPTVITPYTYGEIVPFPADQPAVTVHHADGQDRVDIERCGDDLREFAEAVAGSPDLPCPPGAEQGTGFSRSLSFDEAFAAALASLPPVDPPFPDALTRVRVLEVGGLFGGFPGFHDLFVRICRTVGG